MTAGRALDPKLPAIGAAMKLYVGADWLILRLMGLSLLGTAWMLWTLLRADDVARAERLSHGVSPWTALGAYAAIGTIMVLPVLMPRAVARPRHVGFGMVKAALLVLAAYGLLDPLRLAMVLHTPDAYHPVLLATVPKLFRAVAGIAVTSVLLVAFFRQLGALPAADGRGPPVTAMTAAELREMRAARMGA